MAAPDLHVEQFAALVQERASSDPLVSTRLFGLDLGTKTLGLAVCDSNWSIATPLETIRREKFTKDAERLIHLAVQEKVGGLVMGLPLNMDESEGPRAQSTRAFVRNLGRLTDLPVLFWDERLTSEAAIEAMFQAGIAQRRHGELVDQYAAKIILESCLEPLRQAVGLAER